MNKRILRSLLLVLVFSFLFPFADNNDEIVYMRNTKVIVDNQIDNMNSFLIKGSNYISLRELSYLMRDFLTVDFDNKESFDEIVIADNVNYYLRKIFRSQLFYGYTLEGYDVKYKGITKTIPAYKYNNVNYYKLRDLCDLLSVDIKWDYNRKMPLFITHKKMISVSVNDKKKASKQCVVVLMYHHLLPSEFRSKYFPDNGSVMSVNIFNKHMDWIRNSGYNTITLKQLEEFLYYGKPLPDSKENISILITFDDGYLSNYFYAYPVMKKFNLHGAVFHVTTNTATSSLSKIRPEKLDRFSGEQMFLSEPTLEHASHSHEFHSRNKDGIPFYLCKSNKEINSDLIASSSITGGTRYFAYPYGAFNKNLVRLLKLNGYKLAFTTKRGYVDIKSDPLLLNRFTMWPNTTVNHLSRIMRNAHVR